MTMALTRSARPALSTKESLVELGRPGQKGVKRGDLALIGTPGLIFTPRSGQNCPVIAFGHGWLQPVSRYVSLFRHLASWGIVVVAPQTQRSPFASHRLFAADLSAALGACATLQLGNGELHVDPARFAVGGHSIGGGCAVLAAAADPRIKAVVTLAAVETRPSAVAAASHCPMPSLHLAASDDLVAPPTGNAEPIATAWAGPTQLRMVNGANHLGFTDGRHWSELLLSGKGTTKTRQVTKALVTAFLLQTLCNEHRYDELLDNDFRQASIELLRPGAVQ